MDSEPQWRQAHYTKPYLFVPHNCSLWEWDWHWWDQTAPPVDQHNHLSQTPVDNSPLVFYLCLFVLIWITILFTFFFSVLMFISLFWERKWVIKQERCREREGERIQARSMLSLQSLMGVKNPRTAKHDVSRIQESDASPTDPPRRQSFLSFAFPFFSFPFFLFLLSSFLISLWKQPSSQS